MINTLLSSVYLLFQAICTCVVGYFLYNLLLHPLARLPGPPTARLGLPWFRLYTTITRSYVWNLQKLHKKYGPVVRLGPNFVSTIDEASVHRIYAYNGGFHKTEFYLSFASIPSNPSLFADINDQSHAARRRSVAHVYSMKSLVDLEPFVDTVIQATINKLTSIVEGARRADKSVSSAHVELDLLLDFFAADAVGELAFGETFGLVENGDSSLLLPSARNLQQTGSIAGSLPRLAPLIKPILWRMSGRLTPAIIGRETTKRVKARFQAIEQGEFYDADHVPQRRDMLTGFIESNNSKTKLPLTPTEVIGNATAAFGAGSDTTSFAMCAFFYYVLQGRNGEVYARLMEELESALRSGSISRVPVPYAEGTKLEYFQACMKESMRLMTPVGMEMPRYVGSEGVLAGGHFIPPGTEIGASPWTFHRAKDVFGEDAETFRPERWIGISDEERARMEKNNLVFGSGSKICIGRNVSIMEMTKSLPSLLLKFKFSFTTRGPGSPHSRPAGRGCDGVVSQNEPLWLESVWFCHAFDFWVDVDLRKENGGM
ncbi:cytochrome P450 [Clavulina sp. PMI_390]|nr:cytochrome P450 [Clavulina sp. PMI_390]